QGGFGLHLRSFVTTTKPKSSLNHNLKSVPLALTADSGDFNLKPGTNALLPDGVNYAGKFDPSGADLSLIDY
ncbi:hypothetical protein, partial [Phenylobacterium sp.]|uniref:hypothetical protein n=1 Tax=Phenylobacterium sp. TaxID=1871053 RepID=UPI0035B2BB92